VNALVEADGLGLKFQFDRHRRVVTPGLARLRRGGQTLWALRELRFQIEPGEGVALVGPSGSGKTSLLRLIAGVLVPDEGRIVVRGRVGSLLSVHAGLLPRLTGRENALLLGVLAGLSVAETRAALDAVKERSGLGEAFERPMSSYSQGMRARLGFAVADTREVDVLVLDEVHEALDHEYRQVVAERAAALRRRGGIVVAAGHDHPVLADMCDRALLLQEGSVADDGPISRVAGDYVASTH
jgi:ABC-type polysaccharide/polyol phosphate transport system ATPase subunit